jgi:hypothetical protein
VVVLRLALVAALGALPRRQREAVSLRYLGDLDPLAPGQVVSETLRWEHYEFEGSPAVRTPLAPGVYRIVVTSITTVEATVTLT